MIRRPYLCTVVWMFAFGLPVSVAAQPRATSGEALTDTLRALIIFVKFQDDREPGDSLLAYQGWPLYEDPGTLPSFARSLLAPTPTPPFPDSSLTAYFYQQSEGRFILFGEVYDSVLVSRLPETNYHAPSGGYGYLTKEVLDRIDSYGFDFSRFDHNRDGRLDYLFMVLRRDSQRDAKRFTWTGVSTLDASLSASLAAGRPRRSTLVYDSLAIDWRSSGSFIIHRTPGNIIPLVYHTRVMAHELGHDLWLPFFTHIPAITRNDVPYQSNLSGGTDAIGYALMTGSGGGRDARGDETISAFERDLLGWIHCTPLTDSQANVRVTDLYTTSDCKKIALEGNAAGQVLYVTNRQRLGFFDQARRGGVDGRFEMGLLRTTGLLVTLVDGVRYDVLPADNTLDLSVVDAAYEGDLFSPGTRSQLTPWTRPNSNGYTYYPPGFRPDWHALDAIHYTEGDQGEMAFDYLADFRERPVIREDSWIGEETNGYTFEQDVDIMGGSTLHVGTALAFARTLRVAPGSTLHLTPESTLTIDRSGTLDLQREAVLQVDGTLILDGLVRLSPFARLSIGPTGRIRTSWLRDP